MENEPKLESATFEFVQDGNCKDEAEFEILTIECKSDMGIDNSEGCFYVLKTEQWSIDSLADLQNLIDRINKVIKPE